MANLASATRGSLLLSVHGASPPTHAGWEAHLALMSRLAAEHGGSLARCRSLVYSDGGMPDSRQRNESQALIASSNGRDMRIAMVTSSPVVRGVLTAASWFGLAVRGFAPDSFVEAARYLELDADELRWVRSAAADLAAVVSSRTFEQVSRAAR